MCDASSPKYPKTEHQMAALSPSVASPPRVGGYTRARSGSIDFTAGLADRDGMCKAQSEEIQSLRLQIELYESQLRALRCGNQELRRSSISILTDSEYSQESITNRLLKRIEMLKREKEHCPLHQSASASSASIPAMAAMHSAPASSPTAVPSISSAEQQNDLDMEHYHCEMLQRRLHQVQKEKIELENILEQEQENIVNRLHKQINEMRGAAGTTAMLPAPHLQFMASSPPRFPGMPSMHASPSPRSLSISSISSDAAFQPFQAHHLHRQHNWIAEVMQYAEGPERENEYQRIISNLQEDNRRLMIENIQLRRGSRRNSIVSLAAMDNGNNTSLSPQKTPFSMSPPKFVMSEEPPSSASALFTHPNYNQSTTDLPSMQ